MVKDQGHLYLSKSVYSTSIVIVLLSTKQVAGMSPKTIKDKHGFY